jgi:hypothetical protein
MKAGDLYLKPMDTSAYWETNGLGKLPIVLCQWPFERGATEGIEQFYANRPFVRFLQQVRPPLMANIDGVGVLAEEQDYLASRLEYR